MKLCRVAGRSIAVLRRAGARSQAAEPGAADRAERDRERAEAPTTTVATERRRGAAAQRRAARPTPEPSVGATPASATQPGASDAGAVALGPGAPSSRPGGRSSSERRRDRRGTAQATAACPSDRIAVGRRARRESSRAPLSARRRATLRVRGGSPPEDHPVLRGARARHRAERPPARAARGALALRRLRGRRRALVREPVARRASSDADLWERVTGVLTVLLPQFAIHLFQNVVPREVGARDDAASPASPRSSACRCSRVVRLAVPRPRRSRSAPSTPTSSACSPPRSSRSRGGGSGTRRAPCATACASSSSSAPRRRRSRSRDFLSYLGRAPAAHRRGARHRLPLRPRRVAHAPAPRRHLRARRAAARLDRPRLLPRRRSSTCS